jgi:intracellular multiplication protein IcmP
MSQSISVRSNELQEAPKTALTFPPSVVAVADYWLADDEIGPPAWALARRHGFTAPALMTVLTQARLRAGVLAPAQFAFLKLVDRRLWYALHSLGFPTDGPSQQPHPNPRVEAIGARDHWATEDTMGMPILTPALDRAVAAIRASVVKSPS